MGIDILLSATLPKNARPEGILARAKDWFEKAAAPVLADPPTIVEADDGPLLLVPLFPQSQPVLVRAKPGSLTLEARTNFPGPGYHDYICTQSKRLAKHLGVTWSAEDETEYFTSGDYADLQAHMLSWLQTLAAAVLKDLPQDDASYFLCMGLASGFDPAGAIVTPTGPRTRAWLERVSQDPTAGIDFFPWWDQGLTAATLRNRAHVRMWCDVHWSPPLTEASHATLEEIDRALADAHALDPTLDLPWPAWHEILEHLQSSTEERPPSMDMVEAKAAGQTRATLGYRRRPVTHQIDRWSVTLPGLFEEQDDEHGWVAFGDGKTVRLSALVANDSAKKITDPTTLITEGPPARDIIKWNTDNARLAAFYSTDEEDGEEYHLLNVFGTAGDTIAFATISFTEEADRDWAMQTARTLKAAT